MKLLTANNAKLQKSMAYGYYSVGLHLAPFTLSGFNVCPMASKGCAAACLNTAGMGNYPNVQKSRIEKTKRFFNDRDGFMVDVVKDISSAQSKAFKLGKKLVVRMNLTSDIRWETVKLPHSGKTIFELFPDVQFMDYTKLLNRRDIPGNYHLTVSRSENNETEALATPHNVAIVFGTKRGEDLPKTYKGRNVVDGDLYDMRFLDGVNVVVGLRAKGKGQTDTSGFIVRL